jgi:hypothetical protein
VNNRAESELDRLYGLPLDDFTSARNEAVKQARAQDPRAADILANARKPTRAAWVVNQLARRESKQVQALLRTGDRLRATSSPQALRKATRDQREALDRLMRSVRSHFGQLSETAIDQVRETLQAATIDDEARGLLERGQFTKAQQAVGFIPLAEQEVRAKGAPSQPDDSSRNRKRRAAERRLAAAHERTRKARAELDRAVAGAQEAKKAVEAAHAGLARAEREETEARSHLDRTPPV